MGVSSPAVSGFPFQELVRFVLSQPGKDGWELIEDFFWCRAMAPDHVPRVQGWKLHVSATPLAAPEVLHRSARVLVRHSCSFKFAARAEHIEALTSRRYDRTQCGKFITAYPRDDDHFRELAEALDRATAGLPGPVILSDRPYRQGSLVHYRYGAFEGVPYFSNDGARQVRLRAPDGTLVEDPRKPWFCPPHWTEFPLPGPPGLAARAPDVPGRVLLHQRYAVHGAIRHSARGGVYRAVDRNTGAAVVVKHARPHVGAGLTGRDARDGLRAEAAALVALGGLSADLIEVFEQDDHLFLVETEVPGMALARWVRDRFGALESADSGLPVHEAVSVAEGLVGLMGEVHRRGLVYRDLSPGNVMVTPENELRLIDPEFATEAGAWGPRAFTPGYGAPEYVSGPDYGPVPDQTADLFSLGATLFFLSTGVDAGLAADEPEPRPVADRLDAVLRGVAGRNSAARVLAPAIRGLCAQEPSNRWPLERLTAFLADATSAPGSGAPAAPFRLARAGQDRLIRDGLSRVLADLGDCTGRTWSGSSFGKDTDSCNVQHGAGGILGVLTRADELLGRDDVRTAVARTALFIDAHLTSAPRTLPGLYFGRAGTAWALYDAARCLGDDELAERAVELALALPLRWPNPDVFHGAAGAGLTQLRFWQVTGRPMFLDRVIDCADGLVAAAGRRADGGGLFWRIPPDFDSALAGITHLGFAHGVAGVGTFLVGAAMATGRDDYLHAAGLAGRTLADTAERGPWGARWRTDLAGRPGEGMLYHFCSGASGVGTFLLRLWSATGTGEVLELAEEAALAVRQARWASGTAICHGLAGDGNFLLDMAQVVGGPYHGWAEELAGCLYARHALRDGRAVVPDESGTGISPDFGTGLTGVVDFLLRLRYGGPRLLMADGSPPHPAGTSVPGAGAPRGHRLPTPDTEQGAESDRTTTTQGE
ncbi:class IV lanthionine synthetase LanL [Streptomyces sp. NPDC001177]